MEYGCRDGLSPVSYLPDDCLNLIFQRLYSDFDQESFGLTCHRWLSIQNSSRRFLHFHCSLSELSSLSLPHTHISITCYVVSKLLNRFRQLESLSLSGCIELLDSALTELQYYGSKLRILNLDCCFKITDAGLSLVASSCSSLTVLSLYRCNVSDIGLETISKSCLALQDLNLSWCLCISDPGIRAISQNCRQLTAVRISNCKRIKGIGFEGCSQTLAYLEADSCKLDSEGILGILNGGGLEYLNVSSLGWCIRGNSVKAIGLGFGAKLKILNFRLCRAVCDDTISEIAKGCPLLQEWDLSLCHEIRISGWRSIAVHCRNLEKLHVNRCQNLCDQGLEALRNGCKHLSVLYITNCRQITSLAIELFKMTRSNVEIKREEIMCIAPKFAFR